MGVAAIWWRGARAQEFGAVGSLGGMFRATTATAAAMAQEMKKAVQRRRVAGGGGDGGRPDGEGEDGEHGGFSPGGGAGQDAEEDAESAGDVSRAGEVGKEAMEGDPGGDESGGAVYIDEMREADGDDPEGEEDAGEADTAVAGSKGERGSGGDWGEAGEECPAAGEEHGEFAEAEPGAFDERSCEEVREFEQGPGDEVGEEDLRGQF